MSNLIRINNKLMTKNNKLLTANSGSSGLAYNNNLLKFNNYVIGSGSTPVPPGPVDPYNPLGLPPNTVRVRTSDGLAPTKVEGYTSYETAALVPGTTDVYDVYKSGTDFESLLDECDNVIEILGANTTGVTNMKYMFFDCMSLISVSLFDTSSVTNTADMFGGCYSLASIPLFDTSSVTDMSSMFDNCNNVESGALALYQQASTQATPPSNHDWTFRHCGINTDTGSAELEQIPSSWGGRGD